MKVVNPYKLFIKLNRSIAPIIVNKDLYIKNKNTDIFLNWTF
jgi:hypothetical protein